MKKLIVILLLAGSLTAAAQTNQKRHKFESSGYGAVSSKYSKFNGDDALFAGAYGGWVINHKFLIGLGGYALVTKHDGYNVETLKPASENNLWMGYGGLVLGYKIYERNKFSITSHVLIGEGGIVNAYHNRGNNNSETWQSQEESGFHVIEPEINIEYAVTDWFHVAAGGSYRYIAGADMKGISNKDMSAPTANIAFKFGVF